LLSRERDRHQETTPTSQLGWHPGKLPSYAHQTLDSLKKGKSLYKERGGTRPKPSIRKATKQEKMTKEIYN